ncbi:MAG TPA: PAS domain-containing protein, partial [Candidatus Sulfotelmatobacter sp.]|nr:PAS domain-containing protein [Candidatus Sulfotelmatobacter sp.]
MRLGAKLTLWVLIPLVLVLGAMGVVTLRREQEMHQRAASEQVDRIARVLAIPVADALRRGASEELPDIVSRTGLSSGRFGLVVYDPAGQPIERWGLHAQAGAVDPEAVRALSGTARGRGFAEDLDGLGVRSHLLALADGSRLLGGLKVSLSLSEAHQLLEGERWSFLGMLSVLSLALAVLIFVTIRRQVGLPLARLMSGITTLATGGKLEDLAISGQDEVAQVAREFNQLGRRLDEARKRLLQESEYAQNVIQSITDGIIGVDRDCVIRTWNRAMVERNGIPETEVLGRNLWTTFPAFEREGLRAEVEQLLDGTRREVDLR